MMRHRLPVLVLAALLSACGVRPLVTHRVSIDFPEDKHFVRVNTVTEIADEPAANDFMAERVKAEREALNAQRDEWSLRYGGLHPEAERLVVDRKHGLIERVEHDATIPREELARFFDDSGATVSWTGGGGTSELLIVPASSTRATREQRQRVMSLLNAFSADAADYVNALSHLYVFLDAYPAQANVAYKLILADDDSERSTNEQLQALVEGVRLTSRRITDRLEASRDDALTIDEQFDLVFNPFSSEMVVRVPRRKSSVENFTEEKDGALSIRRSGLLDAVESLEGRWVAPDPLAMSLRGEVTVDQLIAVERHHTAVVSASEIEQALIERLKPATTYRVRWNE